MAKLLRRRRPPEHQRTDRHQLWHGSHGGALRALRCAFGPRVSRWPWANGPALLHELGVARLQAEEVSATKKESQKETMEGRASSPGWTGQTPVPPSSFFEFRLRIQTSFFRLSCSDLAGLRGARGRRQSLGRFRLILGLGLCLRFLIFLFGVAHFDAALEDGAFDASVNEKRFRTGYFTLDDDRAPDVGLIHG